MHSKTIHRAIAAAAILFGDIQAAPLKAESELCHNLGNPFENAVSSLGPDGGWNCIVYKNLDCGGDSLLVTKAGTIFDLSKIAGWNDVISSFRCRRQ
ncbi:hypothetical protein CVT25_000545 [Psilocybe cyanescens]|uniref:Uncharacterized protein n=1 Tax=Psilocybe cyanescens TaxID=93625 RepID=A0A409WZW2_PSICY|nr:hypothetical protein CVT25_000545 [Psilocybe cyanescens]